MNYLADLYSTSNQGSSAISSEQLAVFRETRTSLFENYERLPTALSPLVTLTSNVKEIFDSVSATAFESEADLSTIDLMARDALPEERCIELQSHWRNLACFHQPVEPN